MFATVLRAVIREYHSLLKSPITNYDTWIHDPITTPSTASSTLSAIDHILQITSTIPTSIENGFSWQIPTLATNESMGYERKTPTQPHATSPRPSPVDAIQSQFLGGNALTSDLLLIPSSLPPKINRITGWVEPVTPEPRVDGLAGRLHGEIKGPQGDISDVGSSRMRSMSLWIVGFIYSLTSEGQGRGSPAPNIYDKLSHTNLAERVYRVLLCSIMSPSTLFMALYFVEQLPFLLHSDDDVSRRELHRLILGDGIITTEEIIFRAFVVGSMIADKAHNDDSLRAIDWSKVSLYDVTFLKEMEFLSLKAIRWNTVITVMQWDTWMKTISHYHATLGCQGAEGTHHDIWNIIDRVRDGDPHWDCNCTMGTPLNRAPTQFSPPPIYTASTNIWQECNADTMALLPEGHTPNLICAMNSLPPPLHASYYPEDTTPLPYFKGRCIRILDEVGKHLEDRTATYFQIPPSSELRDSVARNPLEEPRSLPRAFSYTTAESLAQDLLAGRFSVPSCCR